MLSKLWAIIVLIFIAGQVESQDDIDIKLSSTYAIQNAHITQSPGKTIDKGTVVIKDGVIISVGTNVAIPPEAIIVDADSLYIYPGFIDAYNNTGEKKAEEKKNEERVKNPGNPPNDRAGITPDRSLSDVYDSGAKSISDWRAEGFTASFSAPAEGMLPGKASLILLSGKDASQSTVVKDKVLVGTFQSASRMYPATIIGVMAKYRDLFRQTSYAMKHQSAYDSNPVGMSRPAYDKSLGALMPAADKKQLVFMEAEKYKDVSRALTLQADLDFNMALVNVKQGTSFIDVIKQKSIPVVLSMEVPESEDKKDKKKVDAEKEDSAKDDEAKSEEDEVVKEEIDPEMEALKARRDEAIKDYQEQAAMFAKSGVKFGLSGKDIKAKDLKKNAKLMMEQGITEDQLLAALTVNPAEMLGVSNILGTVEKGKMANLVISTAPYFEEDAKVKYVFVEGEQFEYDVEKKKAKVAGKEGDITGLYDCVLEVPGDERDMKINIKKDGDEYVVSVENDGESEEVESVKVNGNSVSFPLSVQEDGQSLNLTFSLTVEDGEISGTVDTGVFGAFPIKGDRIGDPKSN
ncbi:amidohydrolase family protein [Portibacter marinus]|uniref:amidohydrolase family protein n=1 Tax=Portibacter marinus TaxID=2898660 RepID=UPI001F2542CD|nr:amidohydrolase family protein [Portibacter marinus]